MIATFATSPLGLILALGALALGLFVAGILERRKLERQEEKQRATLRRAAPRKTTFAGILFTEAGQAGRPECRACGGEGGRLELHPIPWGRMMELEAQPGIELGPGVVLPFFRRCAWCQLQAEAQLAAEARGELGQAPHYEEA